MTALAITLDHTVWEDYLNKLTGVTLEGPAQRVTADRAGLSTILAAIQGDDPPYDIPDLADRKLLMFPS